jgi:acetolactate decarboxylase
MFTLTTEIPRSLQLALERESRRTNSSVSTIVTQALAEYLDATVHTLFQISTSGALVAGVYAGAVDVKTLLSHGDFGLGTFAHLDGEMVLLDGTAYQIQAGGRASIASQDAAVPFAVVVRFTSDSDIVTGPLSSVNDLQTCCDALRSSGNIFYVFRLDGLFNRIRVRIARPPGEGVRLVEAVKAQDEVELADIAGTLVGLWSPGFSSAFSIPGYHFHFLSRDRQRGGHLLECTVETLRLRMMSLRQFHLALPETHDFLKADLSRSTAGEIAYAEQAH